MYILLSPLIGNTNKDEYESLIEMNKNKEKCESPYTSYAGLCALKDIMKIYNCNDYYWFRIIV